MVMRCRKENNNGWADGRRGEGKERGRETQAEYMTYLDNSYTGL
jgi:hypothetical protein